ncbi:hypothetical protein CFP56_020279 [Quercus suber]|uniref:Uncharacterized protein n=1 Tax=Quercus suber TaxID=58331 RepID=A0AAW0KH16_QUESU
MGTTQSGHALACLSNSTQGSTCLNEASKHKMVSKWGMAPHTKLELMEIVRDKHSSPFWFKSIRNRHVLRASSSVLLGSSGSGEEIGAWVHQGLVKSAAGFVGLARRSCWVLRLVLFD